MSLPWECKLGLPVPSQPGSQEVKYMKSWDKQRHWLSSCYFSLWAWLAAYLKPTFPGHSWHRQCDGLSWGEYRAEAVPPHQPLGHRPASHPLRLPLSGTFLSSWCVTMLSWLLYRMAFLIYMQKCLGVVPLAFERAESQVGNPAWAFRGRVGLTFLKPR